MVEVVSHAPIETASGQIQQVFHTVFNPKLWLGIIILALIVGIGVVIYLLLRKNRGELEVYQKYFDDITKSCKVSTSPSFFKARWNPLSLLLIALPAGSVVAFFAVFKYLSYINSYLAKVGMGFIAAAIFAMAAGLLLLVIPVGTAVLIPLWKSKRPADVYLANGAKLGTFGGVLEKDDKLFFLVLRKILGVTIDKMLIVFPRRVMDGKEEIAVQNWEFLHNRDIRLLCSGVERKREEGYYIPVGHRYYKADLTPYILKEFKGIRDEVMWKELLEKDSKAMADAIELNPPLAYDRRKPSKIRTEEGGEAYDYEK